MNDQYKSIHQEAINLQFRFRDHVEDKSQPAARELESEIQKVVDDLETHANPHSIDDLIKHVEQQLKSLEQSNPPIMETGHAEELYHDFERLRMSLRELDNY